VHFFSVSICVLCFLLWAASYDGLMPSLEACNCNNLYVYVMYMYLVNKLSLSLVDVVEVRINREDDGKPAANVFVRTYERTHRRTDKSKT